MGGGEGRALQQRDPLDSSVATVTSRGDLSPKAVYPHQLSPLFCLFIVHHSGGVFGGIGRGLSGGLRLSSLAGLT